MKFPNWAGGACTLAAAAVTMTLAGCGGGGGGSSSTPASITHSASITATSGSKAIADPTVSAPTTDTTTGTTTVSITDPATGTTLNSVVVPANAALQPTTGAPALLINAATLNLGVGFQAPLVRAAHAAPRATTAYTYATLYEGSVVDPAHQVLQVGLTQNGQLLNSVALGGATDTYTLDFQNVVAPTSPGKSLVINHLDFVFQVRTVGGVIQNSLLTSLKGVLPAFGESMTHDPTKPDYTGGGILFTDAPGTAGTASLLLVQANGQFNKSATLGNDGTDGTGQPQTQILTGSSGATMAAPCSEVQLTCLLQ